MTGPTQFYEPEEGETMNVTHETFARAAISKVLLPPDPVHVAYAQANALIAIYGVLAEISANLRHPAISTEVDNAP